MSERFMRESGPVTYRPSESAHADRREAEACLTLIPGVEGVGEGRDDIGNPAWIAYVRDAAVAKKLPAQVAGRSVVPEISGGITILPALSEKPDGTTGR